MDWDDLAPPPGRPAPKDLTRMSVAELEGYIAELKAEIARAEAMIAAKRSHRDAADGIFKR